MNINTEHSQNLSEADTIMINIKLKKSNDLSEATYYIRMDDSSTIYILEIEGSR